MQKFWCNIIGLILSSFMFSSQANAAEIYQLDPNHTYVLWRINHLGFSPQAGKWYATGMVMLDKDKPENSKVNAEIDVRKMVTGLPELDKHLKGPLFFDVQNHPKATFVSDKVVMTGSDTADVQGTLTLHGVSKPLTLKVKLNKAGMNDISKKMTAGFTATTTLRRSDFGIKTFAPALGDEVLLEIGAEANQEKLINQEKKA